MDPVTTQALEDLKTLLREKVITLAEWRQEVLALRAAPPARQAAPAMDEKHNDDGDGPRSNKLTDAEVDDVLNDWLAEDEDDSHKDAPDSLEHKEEEELEHKEGPTRVFHAEIRHPAVCPTSRWHTTSW